jgi:hypothetical protein
MGELRLSLSAWDACFAAQRKTIAAREVRLLSDRLIAE